MHPDPREGAGRSQCGPKGLGKVGGTLFVNCRLIISVGAEGPSLSLPGIQLGDDSWTLECYGERVSSGTKRGTLEAKWRSKDLGEVLLR